MKNKILFIVATHGDESFSISVMEKLEKKFDKDIYGYDWIIGNPKAQELNTRYCEVDLNRNAPGDINSSVYEEKRAAEIIELAKKYDYVIDIHGSIAPCGIVTIIPYPTLANIFFASSIGVENNIIWNSKSSIQKGALVKFIDRPAIEIECGSLNDTATQIQLEKILSDFLIRKDKQTALEVVSNAIDQIIYSVYGKLEGDHSADIIDFQEYLYEEESFYPFLSNQYPMIKCYKMKKVKFENLFLY